MKKISVLFCVALMACFALPSRAAQVDVATAQANALGYLRLQVATGVMKASPNVSLKLAHTQKFSQDASMADFYVFNVGNDEGFIIMSGDDRAESVLAQIEKGSYTDFTAAPANIKAWINHYVEELEWLNAHPDAVVDKPVALTVTAVSPLLTTKWDQSYPYYNQCPTSGSTHMLTGCIATALAQVMNYWEYPATLPALSAYTDDNGNSISALSSTSVNWDYMDDTYSYWGGTSSHNAEVAKLMRYCGQASHMAYSVNGSGAYVRYNGHGQYYAAQTFGYEVKYGLKTSYSETNWNTMMQSSLQSGRPILYSGVDPDESAGHAFVVDGINSSSKYHCNFGWSGSYDGYYALNSFTAQGSTFSSQQEMLYDMVPPSEAGNPIITVTPNPLEMTAAVGATSTATLTVKGYNLTGNVTVSLNDANGIFAVTPTTISASSAMSGTTVTVSYTPVAGGSKSATITLSSSGADDKTVDVSGTATFDSSTPVMLAPNADYITLKSFRAEWADATDAASVASYSLIVTRATSSTLRNAPVERGDSTYRSVTGITNKYYDVANLVAGGTFTYKVQAVYTDGTKSDYSNIMTVTLSAPEPQGNTDINDDGTWSMGDVTTLIAYVLGNNPSPCLVENCDITGDGSITMADVTALIAQILGN